MKNTYQTIKIEDLNRFLVEKQEDKYLLKMKSCQNKIFINLPFKLNEDVATLAGMMPDASLIKDIRRVYFSQKKDFKKNVLFRKLLNKLFRPNNKVFIRKGKNCHDTYTNSTVLCHFLHHILDFAKSDENMRTPEWIFNSPESVKRAYLREAFAMEGCIFKSLSEIRFYTKDYNYALDIQDLLSSLSIKSFLKSRIAGTHDTVQYRVSIYRKENFEKFKEIGFTNPLHVKRFKKICNKYNI